MGETSIGIERRERVGRGVGVLGERARKDGMERGRTREAILGTDVVEFALSIGRGGGLEGKEVLCVALLVVLVLVFEIEVVIGVAGAVGERANGGGRMGGRVERGGRTGLASSGEWSGSHGGRRGEGGGRRWWEEEKEEGGVYDGRWVGALGWSAQDQPGQPIRRLRHITAKSS